MRLGIALASYSFFQVSVILNFLLKEVTIQPTYPVYPLSTCHLPLGTSSWIRKAGEVGA